jgi:hypothetical protein
MLDLPTLLSSENLSDPNLSSSAATRRSAGHRHERNSQINNEEDLQIIFEKIASVQKIADKVDKIH